MKTLQLCATTNRAPAYSFTLPAGRNWLNAARMHVKTYVRLWTIPGTGYPIEAGSIVEDGVIIGRVDFNLRWWPADLIRYSRDYPQARIITARRPNYCFGCHRPIRVGEQYLDPGEGKHFTCVSCAKGLPTKPRDLKNWQPRNAFNPM
jgi:hypothetical protein